MSSGILISMYIFLPLVIHAQVFEYQFPVGNRYRIISHVTQHIHRNDVFLHSANFQNIINVEILDNGIMGGTVRAQYRILEELELNSEIRRVQDEHDITYTVDKAGIMAVPDNAFVPMVRNVPRFPKQTLSIGSTWTFPAEEVFDFRIAFGISQPFKIDTIAKYEYLGLQKSVHDQQEYHAINITYPLNTTRRVRVDGRTLVISIFGNMDQTLLWDDVRGRPHSYSEEYRFGWTEDDTTLEFVGSAEAYTTEVLRSDDEARRTKIENELEEASFADVTVDIDDEGVVLTLGKLQFYPDSARLLLGEENKVVQLAELIAIHDPAQVLIIGHTARAGNEDGRQQLSELRAQTVGALLQKHNIRNLVIQGVGATQPIADNNTQSGRQINRRVEIKLIGNEN